ncbi:NAD(P)-binding protein [Aliarcobacter cryaerophilus]|uniref:NAD(P)-binding protein n=1 Tax=Aliarcobacter cryaerophilus TaxID=28198 RepID=UPI0021B6931E|nr:NAD(P)-binding protein [Aliarcobacter cryaerophilus]MCT7531809.1 NAD(P)-binding protein [Aliarcobacter cryaerophilus]
MSQNIIVVGGGIAGLVSALLLSENKHNKITIIEKDKQVGGLLKKYDYKDFGCFDYGMHNILETGIKQLDSLIFNLLSQEEWQLLEGNKRDLAGVYINNKLQKNSPYIDLREYRHYTSFLDSFFNRNDIGSYQIDQFKTAGDFLSKKYGSLITDCVFKSILEKLYKSTIDKLDPMSTVVTPMGRIILLNESVMKEINKSEQLKSLLAYPEQRNLNLNLSSGRKAYYPKKYGIYRIIEAMVEVLKDRNVELITDDYVTKINHNDKKIDSIKLNSGVEIDNIETFIWSADLINIYKLLSNQTLNYNFDLPAKTSVTNIVIDKKLNLDDLYYLYCYEKDLSTFRVTPYYNYCDGAIINGTYKICVEMLIYDDIDSMEILTKKAISELSQMNLLEKNTNILFAKTEILNNGFPRPTKNNIEMLDNIRNEIKDKKISNLINIGILAEKNLFFQTDVLIDLYKKMESLK